jgi:hypothetical protein
MYRVVGKTLQIKYFRLGSASDTSVGGGEYAFSIPSGLTINTNLNPICNSSVSSVMPPYIAIGTGIIRGNSQSGNILPYVASSTTIKLHTWIPGVGTGFVTSSYLGINNPSFAFYVDIEVPIL